MKYYSEKTKNIYETIEDLEKAEKALVEEQAQAEIAKQKRAEAAKEVENAFKLADKAKADAMDKLKAFCKEYGSFRTSIDSATLNEIKPSVFSSLFDIFNF